MAPPIESAAVYNMSAVAGKEEAEKSQGCWRGGTEGARELSEGEGKTYELGSWKEEEEV